MKIFGYLLLGMWLCQAASAREINVRLWISGGAQGLVLGTWECPGWLSLAQQLQSEDPEGCWVHLGAPPLDAEDLNIPGLKFPDVLIPTEADFRLQGRAALEAADLPFSLLNVSNLPQFPEYHPSFAGSQLWKQSDGIVIQVFGLLSAPSPLRIPADRLRPLRVLDPLESLREYLTENPLPATVFPVLALPEDADGRAWSKLFPEIPILIESPVGQPKIIEVQGGKQLRVQPGRSGRALIRVQLYWDTVSRSFRDPTAEKVWVYAPDLQGLNLSAELTKHIRPISEDVKPVLADVLIKQADAVLLPEMKTLKISSRLPDVMRLDAVPEDQAWARVEISRSIWDRWKKLQGFTVLEQEDLGDKIKVLITGETLAGNGDWHSMIREDVLQKDLTVEWMPFTSRELLLPLESAP